MTSVAPRPTEQHDPTLPDGPPVPPAGVVGVESDLARATGTRSSSAEGPATVTALPRSAPDRSWRSALDPRVVAGGAATTPLVTIALLNLVTEWDDQAFALLLPEIQDELGLSLAVVGVLVTITRLVSSLGAPVIGYLADRVKRVRLLQAGSLVANVGSILTGLSPANAAALGGPAP